MRINIVGKFILLIIASIFIHVPTIFASYMLPYPSVMPGNKIYKISRFIDSVKRYWYFGDIAQIKYHLMLADKYLVEAKILFEYKQYLLAQDALKRSDEHFLVLNDALWQAKNNHKNITSLAQTVGDAAEVHKRVLLSLQAIVPEAFDWSPEDGDKVYISIHEMILNSIQIREKLKVNVP